VTKPAFIPRIVEADKPPEPEIHIGDMVRADVAKRDWARCHVTGDRAPPLYLPERAKRGWRG